MKKTEINTVITNLCSIASRKTNLRLVHFEPAADWSHTLCSAMGDDYVLLEAAVMQPSGGVGYCMDAAHLRNVSWPLDNIAVVGSGGTSATWGFADFTADASADRSRLSEALEETQWMLDVQDGALLVSALSATICAASTDETRAVLNSVCLTPDPDRGLVLVATDGCRLHVVGLLSCMDAAQVDAVTPTIIPSALVKRLLKMAPKKGLLQIVRTSGRIAFFWEAGAVRYKLSAKVLLGNYPNYRQVVPEARQCDAVIEVSVDAAKRLLVDLKALAAAAGDACNSVDITLGVDGRALYGNARNGDSRLSVPLGLTVKNSDVARPFPIRVNGKYLSDIAGAASRFGGFALHVRDAYSPLLIVGQQRFEAVVMPLRIT